MIGGVSMDGDIKWNETTIDSIIAGNFLPMAADEQELNKMNAAIDAVRGSSLTNKTLAKQTLEIEFMSK